jgi:hypothetical protein
MIYLVDIHCIHAVDVAPTRTYGRDAEIEPRGNQAATRRPTSFRCVLCVMEVTKTRRKVAVWQGAACVTPAM